MQRKNRSIITLLDISKLCLTNSSTVHCHSQKEKKKKKSSRVQRLHIQNKTERKQFKNPFKFLFKIWLLKQMHTHKHNERLRIDS